MVPVIIALMWALAEVWRDLFDRRHPPYTALQKAADALGRGDATAALRGYRGAAASAARHGDLAALGAAWKGIARSREALGDAAGAGAANAAADDAQRQLN
jgi:hypothetical protein